MHYQKPVVMDLGRRARYARGQDPLGCISGSSADGNGIGVAGTTLCTGGNYPGDGDCRAGNSAQGCGAGAVVAGDFYGCRVGSVVF